MGIVEWTPVFSLRYFIEPTGTPAVAVLLSYSKRAASMAALAPHFLNGISRFPEIRIVTRCEPSTRHTSSFRPHPLPHERIVALIRRVIRENVSRRNWTLLFVEVVHFAVAVTNIIFKIIIHRTFKWSPTSFLLIAFRIWTMCSSPSGVPVLLSRIRAVD